MLLPLLLGAVFNVITLEGPINVTSARPSTAKAPPFDCNGKKKEKTEKKEFQRKRKDICSVSAFIFLEF